MQISQIINFLETIAPLSMQESYDNAGLITGSPAWDCSGAMISLDITDEVLDEALKNNCNLLIAHHPIIFKGLKRITGNEYVGRNIIRAIKNDLAIYAIHTNLDNVLEGVNGKIAEMIGLADCQALMPLSNTHPGYGSGLTGHLSKPMDEKAFLGMVRDIFKIPVIRHSGYMHKPIQQVSLCGGAGSFLISNAIANNSAIFLTADLKYHDFFEANNRIVLADIGHFESEQFTTDLVYGILKEKFPTFAVLKTGVNTNPINYFF
ncbi:MAG: Nif3-like dinuclear metal center hexameric protein [Chitinophagaceae bacterium]